MATLTIKINPDEKKKLLAAIKKHKGQTISVAKLASAAGLNPNRSRFIIEEMLQEGTIKRTRTKAFNERYVRYSYEVV